MSDCSSFPNINNLMRSMPPDDGVSPLISDRFALEFGNLSCKSLQKIPESSRVAVGISCKCLQKLGSNITWKSVLEIAMNNPSLQVIDVDDIYHHEDHKVPAGRWFQSDGYFDKSGVR